MKPAKNKRGRPILTGLLVIFLTGTVTAQEIKVNSYAGFVFKNHVSDFYSDTSYYNGYIKDGLQYGVGIEYLTEPKWGIELLYLRQHTSIGLNYYLNEAKYTKFGLDINYLLACSNAWLRSNERLNTVVAAMAGIALLKVSNPETGFSNRAAKFAGGLKGGVSYRTGRFITWMAQATLIIAVKATGGELYFGENSGPSTYGSILQFGANAGIAFHFPCKRKEAR